MNKYDTINGIFNELPDYLKNKRVYESFISSIDDDRPRGYSFSQLLGFFIIDVLDKNGITNEDFRNQKKGRKIRSIIYVRTWFVSFLKDLGYTLPEISKMLGLSWHIVRRCHIDFNTLMEDERFEIGYNKFIILSRKYF